MHLYEQVLMSRQDVSSQQVEELIATYKGVLEENGGTFEKVEYWGLKSLAYKIKKNRKAHYSFINISAPPAALAEMERRMRIDDNILRFLTIRVEEHDEELSVMMQKRDRDDRRRRDDRPGGGDRPPRDDRPPRRDRDEGADS